ncbi:MAG: hypothetical protein ACPLRM_09070, partial [Anaerolineae bacterium]
MGVYDEKNGVSEMSRAFGTVARAGMSWLWRLLGPTLLMVLLVLALVSTASALFSAWMYGALPAEAGEGAEGGEQAGYERAALEYFPEVVSEGKKEEEHRVPWGLLMAVDFFGACAAGRQVEYRGSENALALRPEFEYRNSVVVTERTIRKEDGTTETKREERPVKLLVRARTYKGTYTYSYKWVTECDENVKTRREVEASRLYEPDYSPLEALLEKRCGAKPEMETLLMVEKAGEAFNRGESNLEWLLNEEESWLAEALGGQWSSDLPPVGGEYVWPVEAEITSPFGERVHPVFRV